MMIKQAASSLWPAVDLNKSGADTIPVPDVAGLDVPAATKQITDAGLKPQQRQQTSDTVPAAVPSLTHKEPSSSLMKATLPLPSAVNP